MIVAGEVYKDRRRDPLTIVLVLQVYTHERGYERVRYMMTEKIMDVWGYKPTEGDVHEDSFRKMFPYRIFDPVIPDDEDK